ncbi:hypothetical protein A6I89_07645 [Prescottella equi]|nr:hypothetical protein A6I89_07645 [Prescottella equi]ORM04461.1 hypothetical protein A5N73_07365 [Prescottella equi]ORM31169.1 hypothetical protein A5N68_02830 [Prescottella equi]
MLGCGDGTGMVVVAGSLVPVPVPVLVLVLGGIDTVVGAVVEVVCVGAAIRAFKSPKEPSRLAPLILSL